MHQATPIAPWKLFLASTLAILTLVAFFAGTLPTGIAAALFTLCILQGLWRGATELAGLVIGMVLAALLAAPIGRLLEGLTSAAAGTTGLTNRFASIAAAALLITILCTLAFGLITRRFLKNHQAWKRWDSPAGAALGAIEGSILAMLVFWVPLALAPVAKSQLEAAATRQQPQHAADNDANNEPDSSQALASSIVQFSQAVESSSMGAVAQATNPVPGTQIMVLASDFAEVTRDPAAMDHLLNSPVLKEIQEMPSLVRAMERIREDPQLSQLVDSRGVSVDTIRTVLASNVFLDILDSTSVIADLMPKAEQLATAIAEAKATIDRASPK
jgi:hypothetical protein